ncbi:MAG: hypothetical protein WCQ54_13895 [Clostridiaceae bacterium]
MNIRRIIPLLACFIMIVLIILDYILIRKPYKYALIVLIFIGALVQTPLFNGISRRLELIFGIAYFTASMVLLISYGISEKER